MFPFFHIFFSFIFGITLYSSIYNINEYITKQFIFIKLNLKIFALLTVASLETDFDRGREQRMDANYGIIEPVKGQGKQCRQILFKLCILVSY